MNTPVSFELAKLLKEKGFSWECSHFYCKSKYYKKFYLTTGTEYESDRDCIWDWNLNGGKSGNLTKTIPYPNDTNAIYYSAPTIIEVVMWLYEKHGIWISVSPVFEFNDGRKDYLTLQGYQYYITVITDNKYNQEKTHADRGYKNTPTEAYEAAIEYTLKNLL
jgi:hypothetical protein